MFHACHRFWKCYKVPTFCSLLTRCTILCACHAKRHLNVQNCSVPVRFLHFWLGNVLRATTACTFPTSQPPKVVRAWCVLYILTSKCASRHNGVHFFDISTSKSGPNVRCFVHFDLERCFAPQWCALFRHLNFQKWSERKVLLAFSLTNVLRATTACNFSSLIWPAGSAPTALASLLFDPPEPQIIGKTQCFATFLPFRAPASSFFWLFLFSDLLSSTLLFSLTLPISAFHLSILSEVWLLNFLRSYNTYNALTHPQMAKSTWHRPHRRSCCREAAQRLAPGTGPGRQQLEIQYFLIHYLYIYIYVIISISISISIYLYIYWYWCYINIYDIVFVQICWDALFKDSAKTLPTVSQQLMQTTMDRCPATGQQIWLPEQPTAQSRSSDRVCCADSVPGWGLCNYVSSL